MKPFTSVSASQIDVHMRCRRRWYFEKILGIRPEQAATAALGEELHSLNEKYLLTGDKPKKGTKAADLFYAGLSFLPPPGTVNVETVVENHPTPGYNLAGITIRGKIDLTDLREDGDPWVEDYKTTSSMKWALTRDQIAKSPQMVMYAQFLRHYLPTIGKGTPSSIRVSHLVYLKDGNIVSRTGPVRLTTDHLDSQWSRLEGIVSTMKETAVIPAVDKVQATLSSCGAFGGCPHQKYCTAFSSMSSGASPFSGIEAAGGDSSVPCSTVPNNINSKENLVTLNPMDALAALKAKNAAGLTAPTIVAPVAVAPAAVAAPAPAPTPPGKSALELLAEKARANTAAAGPAKGLLSNDAPAQVATQIIAPAVTPIAPVVAPAVPTVTEAPLSPVHQRKPKGYMTKLTGLGYSESQIEEMGVDRMHEVIDAELRADAPKEASVEPEPAPKVEVKVEVALPKAQVPTLNVQTGLTLYIDCMPSKGSRDSEYTRLEELLLPYMAEVARGGEKGDGRAPLPHYSMISYGQGTSRVVAMVLTNPPKGVIVADRRYPCTDAVLEVLVPMAENVVR